MIFFLKNRGSKNNHIVSVTIPGLSKYFEKVKCQTYAGYLNKLTNVKNIYEIENDTLILVTNTNELLPPNDPTRNSTCNTLGDWCADGSHIIPSAVRCIIKFKDCGIPRMKIGLAPYIINVDVLKKDNCGDYFVKLHTIKSNKKYYFSYGCDNECKIEVYKILILREYTKYKLSKCNGPLFNTYINLLEHLRDNCNYKEWYDYYNSENVDNKNLHKYLENPLIQWSECFFDF